MAAAMVGIRFVTYLARFGVANAVVQRPELEGREISTAWWLATAVAVVVSLLTLLVAPLVASLLRVPEAEPVIRWLAPALAASSIGSIPEALLRRRLRFAAISLIQVVSYTVAYAGVGLALAASGWGVWSLVAATVAQAMTVLVISSFVAGQYPRLEFDRPTASAMLRFGGTVSATGFVEFLSANVDVIAVGRFTNPASLGQYARGTLLVALPIEQLSTSIYRVLLPGLSRLQFDRERFDAAVVVAIGMQSIVVVVPAAVIAASAELMVPALLGPGWDLAASVVPVIAVAYSAALLTVIPAVAAEALGAVGRRLAVQLISLCMTIGLVSLVVITGPSVLRLAAAWVAGELIRMLLYVALILPALGLPVGALATRYATALALGGCVAGPVAISVHALALGWLGVAVAALLGLMIAGVVVLSPLGRSVQDDVRGAVERWRAGSSPGEMSADD
jgi:O-antigen/teichoic acid export membrane protein